ncbi:hypothetical protein SEA_OBLADI_138 [Gordonia phage ObLaDi]|uniref:Uncharacterized protein n=2 Tax=Cafassovirus TaxID=3425056 RepID=A0A9E7QBX2_9CAUD|nr:hypothetical protein SEA_ALEEMILY_137 [Gordonia phage Aleemily]UXE03861.1 hypothetical protein SEA_OBLADI_138 [Gordonia phage ObLaDi]
MKMTVKFTDVYDHEEHERTEEIDVERPSTLEGEEFDEWAIDEIMEHTGDGNAISKQAGYFAEIVACADMPELVGTEFEWGT